MECGCGYVPRWGLPWRHVLAVCERTNTLDRLLTLIPESFRLENYRSTAYTPALKIVLPTWGQLKHGKTRRDPPRVKQACAPTKGRPREKRIPGVGDYAWSSKYNIAIAAPAPSSTTGAQGGAPNSAPAPGTGGGAQVTLPQGSTIDLSPA